MSKRRAHPSPDQPTGSTTFDAAEETAKPGLSRRALLTGGAAGALIGVGGGLGIAALRGGPGQHGPVENPDIAAGVDTVQSVGWGNNIPGFGREALPCHGVHQAGIVSALATHARYIAYTLRPETDRDALERMFRVLTGDVEGLTSGSGPLADPEPELAGRPARLTITVGVGPDLVDRIGPQLRPEWLAPLPPFERDRLSGDHDGGDMFFLLQADDELAVAHAARMLHRDMEGFAELHWIQRGFRQARGSEPDGATPRNLMGQVDGTINPHPEEETFDSLVWLGADAGWLEGGTALVLRRIRMELDTWDMVDRPGREQTIGRRLTDGAPLTGGDEHTPVDFEAKNELGLPVIPSYAHARRAHSNDPNERIFRRSVNYDDDGEAGQLFTCYQQNPLEQFVPIQERLDELDLLNEWITHTGSAVFAILPGFQPDEMLGGTLFA